MTSLPMGLGNEGGANELAPKLFVQVVRHQG